MKIGIITDAIDDNAGGIQTYVRGLVENIFKIDKKNKYYLIHHKKSGDPIYKKRREIIIPLRPFPFYREIRKIFVMHCILKKYKLDLVHETAQIGPFFFPAPFKKIITIHDLVPLKYPKTNTFFVWLHHRIGLPLIIKQIDKIIAVSNNTKKDIMTFFGASEKKIQVIYEGHFDYYKKIIDPNKLKEIKDKYNLHFPFILFIGTIEPRKNINRVIKAFARIKESIPSFKLVIVGKTGWKCTDLYALIKATGLQDKIIFTGYVPEEDLPTLNTLATVLVYPSLYEGFGLSPLGAMKCGCPVVSSNCSSIPEVVGSAGVLVNPFSIKEIAESILVIIKNEKRRYLLIKKGFLQSKKFDWKKFAKQTIKLYEKTVKKTN